MTAVKKCPHCGAPLPEAPTPQEQKKADWLKSAKISALMKYITNLDMVSPSQLGLTYYSITAPQADELFSLLEMAGVLPPPLPASSSRRVLVKDEAAGMAKLRNLAFPKICEYCGSTINI